MDNLRPSAWSEYVGQERLKRELEVRIESAIVDERPLDHVLLYGPAGVGKTALAQMIATRLGEPMQIVTMPIGIKPLVRLVNSFSGILVLDEIHRCSNKEQENLLPLLEFGYVQDTSGRKVDAEWLTIIGATTEKRELIEPLVDRFDIQPEWENYSDEDLTRIILGMADKSGITLDEPTAVVLGKASAGIPRRARRFVLSYRDLENDLKRPPTADEVLALCRTETDGLTTLHIKYLETLDALGGVKGLAVLCSLLRESPAVLIELERLLIEKALIIQGDRGRELTRAGSQRIRGPVKKTRQAVTAA